MIGLFFFGFLSILGASLGWRIIWVHRYDFMEDRKDVVISLLFAVALLFPVTNLLIVKAMTDGGLGPELPKMRIWQSWKDWWAKPINWA